MHLWDVYVRANVLILDLDGGDTGGDAVSCVTHYGHEATLDEVVGPGLVAVNTVLTPLLGGVRAKMVDLRGE